MNNFVSKCGIDCGACPWGPFPRKKMTKIEFDQYKNKAKKILGYMPIKTPCVTCLTPDDKIPKTSKLPSRKCPIRQCVDKSGILNCGYCIRFPCDTLKETAGLWTREKIESKLEIPLSEEDYRSFVEPFEGLDRLERIHNSLNPDEIVEPKKFSKPTRKIIEFPFNLSLETNTFPFKAVYDLLVSINNSSLGLKNTDTFAQKQKLEKIKSHIFRFLWILGTNGNFVKEKNTYLLVDAENFLINRGKEKSLAILSFLQDVVSKVLTNFGVFCEFIISKDKTKQDITTGTGYLRKKGWDVRISFENKIGGQDALKAFYNYSKMLNEKYGSKGFKLFQKANMNILIIQKIDP